jgi:hypothetical protein
VSAFNSSLATENLSANSKVQTSLTPTISRLKIQMNYKPSRWICYEYKNIACNGESVLWWKSSQTSLGTNYSDLILWKYSPWNFGLLPPGIRIFHMSKAHNTKKWGRDTYLTCPNHNTKSGVEM